MPPRRKSRAVTFALPPAMFDQVGGVKGEEGQAMSELVRGALRPYVKDRDLHREQRLERVGSRQAESGENEGN